VIVVFHVVFNVLMVVFNMTAMLEPIVVMQVFCNVLMVMNMTTFSMVTTMMFHMVFHMLMVMLNVTAMLHAMNVAMLLGMRMLNMVQLGFTVMLVSTTMERMTVMSCMIVMFHDKSLTFVMGFTTMFHTQRFTSAHFLF
jgi:hypothetical protein